MLTEIDLFVIWRFDHSFPALPSRAAPIADFTWNERTVAANDRSNEFNITRAVVRCELHVLDRPGATTRPGESSHHSHPGLTGGHVDPASATNLHTHLRANAARESD